MYTKCILINKSIIILGKDLSGLFSCGGSGSGEAVAAGPAKDAKKEPAKVEAAKPAPKKEEPKGI